MRLWTVHPRHLDPRGLVAVWREGLLAQRVLHGRTRGYRHHPQLVRFRAAPDPLGAIARYLDAVEREARARGYAFNRSLIISKPARGRLRETEDQLQYEWNHLMEKLALRSPDWRLRAQGIERPDAHPLFAIVPGSVQDWEKTASNQAL